MSVTMKDIAMLAGVSQQAVSAALSGGGSSRVSKEKREKILKFANELNYVPNAAALILSGEKTKAIGMLGAIGSGLQATLVGEASDILTSKGYNSLIGNYGYANYCATASLARLVSHGVDGVMIMNSDNRAELERLQKVPYVFCTGNHRDPFDVGIDNELTGYIGTNHLLTHGHGKVAFLSVMTPLPGYARLAGWRRAHLERGMDVDDGMIVVMREFDGNVKSLIKILQKLKITAIFASNDYVAAKTMKALIENGVRVPDDIAIVGCDGRSFVDFCPVSLSTVIQPVRKVVELSVDLLLKRIEAGELCAEPANIKINPVIRIGASCGCTAKTIQKLYRINTFEVIEKDMMVNFAEDIF